LPAPFANDQIARVRITDSAGERESVPAQAGWAFTRQAGAFVRDVLDHTQPSASGTDSVRDLELIEAIWKTHYQQRGISCQP
jgi:hypothetical protein